jgi:glucose-6-phosphate 1-dehydrogenase
MENKLENQVIVIFGASGDLTQRKLIPAIYNLYCRGFLPKTYAILGIGRTDYSDDSYREKVVLSNEYLKGTDQSKDSIDKFANLVHYLSLETSNQKEYQKLADRLKGICDGHHLDQNVIFYLSTPPSLYGTIAENLAAQQLNEEAAGWKRMIVEKPFGYDLQSAKQHKTYWSLDLGIPSLNRYGIETISIV